MNDLLKAAAEKLEDEAMRANALALIDRMTTVRQGIGDDVIRWHPTPMRIVQATTDTDSIDGDVRTGDIVYGDHKAPKSPRVYVLRAWDSRAMWNPDLNIKKMMCSSPDGKTGWRFGDCKSCENSKFVDGVPSLCKQQKSFLVVTEDLSDVVVINLSRSSLAIGREWEGKLKKMSVMPFMRIYALTSKKSEKAKAVHLLDPVRTDDYAGDNVAQFLSALFDYFHAERKAELKFFYDKLAEYKEKKAAEGDDEDAPASSSSSVDVDVSVGAQSEEGDAPSYQM